MAASRSCAAADRHRSCSVARSRHRARPRRVPRDRHRLRDHRLRPRASTIAPEWSDDRKRVDTLVTFRSARISRAAPARRSSFRVPGGRSGAIATYGRRAGVQPGDEAVLFLPRARRCRAIFGLNQGVFRVRVDASTAGAWSCRRRCWRAGDAPERRPRRRDAAAAAARDVRRAGPDGAGRRRGGAR